MSNTKKYNSEQIEKYLLNKMSESEKAAFQFEIMRDADLRNQVQEMRSLQKVVVASTLEETNDSSSSKAWWIIPIALFTLAALGYLMWPTPSSDTSNNISTTKDIQTSPSPTEIKPTIEAPATQEEPIKKELPPVVKPKETKPTKPKKKRPIAMADPADLIPNPYLDAYMGGVRSSEISLTINTPQKETAFTLNNGQIDFHFQASLSGENIPELELLLFDNKESSFEDYTPFMTEKLADKISPERTAINLKSKVSLKRGLYYYVIQRVEDQELLTVGNFLVR